MSNQINTVSNAIILIQTKKKSVKRFPPLTIKGFRRRNKKKKKRHIFFLKYFSFHDRGINVKEVFFFVKCEEEKEKINCIC